MAPVDTVLRALASPVRRQVLEQLGVGPGSVKQLAAGFDMALPSFTQHLKLLEASGLVSSEKRGRVRTYRLTPAPLAEVEGWLAAQRSLWERRLDQLDDYLQTLKEDDA